jgi:hypothetical protein
MLCYLSNEDGRARSQMWASLIPGYQEADRRNKKKLKKEYREMNFGDLKCISFDPCPEQGCMPCSPKVAPRKGNDNMYVEQNMTVTEKTAEDSRRTHFLNEIRSIFSKKDRELREKFGLDRPKSPKTPKELVEWIKAGEWSYVKGYDPSSDDEDEWNIYEAPIYGIRWTKVKEDRKGYDKAREILCDEQSKFVNEIWAEVDPANFIKILEKFEKSKLH